MFARARENRGAEFGIGAQVHVKTTGHPSDLHEEIGERGKILQHMVELGASLHVLR